MKQHPDPWANLPPSMWPFSSSNSASALQKLDPGQQNTPRMVLPTYTNPYCTFPVLGARKFTKPWPSLNRPANLNFGTPEFAGYQDRAVGLNQSRDQNSLIFSSSLNPSLTRNPTNQSLDFQGSNEAVSIDHGGEEMHEDTEEINALLYSDSEEEYGEEEASTGHSPMEPTARDSSEPAVSSILPVKRKRVDMDEDEPDTSLLDTASSSFGSHYHDTNANTDKKTSSAVEASCGRGGDRDLKRIKRERILEIIGVLRRIIPYGKGKDATTVLDEAISYLKALKLKAMALASTTIN